MAITVDASSPSPKQAGTASGASTTVQSNTFSPPAGSLVVAFIINTSNANGTTGITSSAGSLSFSKLGSASVAATSYCDCWVADCPSSQTNITLTGTLTSPGAADKRVLTIHVLVLTGTAAAASQTGQIKTGSGVNFHTGVTLASAQSTSWIFASAADWEGADTPTFPAGQGDAFNGQSGSSTSQLLAITATGDSNWVQGNTATGNSNLTMNTTTPNLASAHNSMFAVEILAASGGGSTVKQLAQLGVG